MEEIEKVIKGSKTIAVVGVSLDPSRPSYDVARYLKGQGYHIIPVNPKVEEVLGEKSYPNLSAIQEKVDVVDIFRRPVDVPPVVDEAIEIEAGAVWMQEGIVHEEAAEKARRAGLVVIMDRCLKKEHQRLWREGRL